MICSLCVKPTQQLFDTDAGMICRDCKQAIKLATITRLISTTSNGLRITLAYNPDYTKEMFLESLKDPERWLRGNPEKIKEAIEIVKANLEAIWAEAHRVPMEN